MPISLRDARQSRLDRAWIATVFRDYIDDLDPQRTGIFPVLGEKLLDAGINMGSPTAGKFLQRALNALRGTAASPVDADGVCGAMTRDALKAFLNARGAGGRTVLLNVVAALQSVRYIEIAEGNATDLSFEFGWQRARAFSHIGGAA